MASQAFTFFQTGNLTPDPPTTLTSVISGTNWTNSWVTATSGRAPAGLKVIIYPTATPGTPIQTTNLAVSPSAALYSFTTVTFNTGGTTGRSGPILSAAKSGLTGTPAPSTWYDSYFDMTTTGYQLWTVPATSSYRIRCAGAGTANGLGIIIETSVNLTQGQKIQILVGQQGIRYQTGSSGGCGGSFVASGSTPATGVVLVAAGGGGGTRLSTLSGGVANATTSTTGNTSSDGTGIGGSSGGGGNGSSSGWGGGGGGFTGNGTDATNLVNTRGFSFVNGGLGGNTATIAVGGFGGGAGTHGNTGGGGGGGGYSGGGGSAQTITGLAGGGGSYPSGATNIGTNSGPGYVTITAETASIPTITYASPTYAYGTQYGISVQTSNIQGKLSPAISAVATWLAQPTFTSVTMSGSTFIIIPVSITGATSYLYSITDTGLNTNTSGATSGTFTSCIPGNQYYANVYAIATNSQSVLSANSASVWCLATPVITLGTGTNNIYTAGTYISGTTFIIVWTAVTNASNYTLSTNSSYTYSSSGSITTTPGSGWTAYTFAYNGSIVVPAGNKITVDYLLVGGGGGAGGYIGGGGGGGYYTYKTGVVFTPGTYTFTIGQGGIGQVGTGTPPTSGGSSTITGALSDSAAGGGGQPEFGKGGSSGSFTGGSYTNTTINAGGGAGAGQNGVDGGTYGGNGGNGIQNSITGTSTYYGGGGGGGWYTGNTPGTGGLGGGATGAAVYNPSTRNDGTNGLGGGGGGSTGGGSSIGGNGGSGVVIIRVYSSTATIAPPTVTTSFTVGVNTSYYFIVSATATNSTSQTATTATIYCLTKPIITVGASSTYISAGIMYIAWTAGDANASGYTIYINGAYSSVLASSSLTTSLYVSIGSSYYATLYATALYSTSAASTNSPTIYSLAIPVLTTGSGSYSIYNAGTFIFGTTFTATWSTIANATGYTVTFYNFNTAVTTTYSPTGLTQTQSVTAANRYNVKVSATALYSTSSQSTASSTIYCLTSPSITSGTSIGGSLGTTFTVTWTAGDVNASGYTIFLNGTGTPNTTNLSTLTTPFTVVQGSAYYATVYATASYSTSPVSTTATIPCILLTFTVSMLGTTLTASVAATPNGYSYSYSVLTLYKNDVVTSPAVTGSPFTGLLPGSIYSVAASATATNSASGTVVSVSVPCIGFTWTLSISATSLTGSFIMSPSGPSYPYTYTSFILNTNGSATATTSTLDAFGFLSYTVAAGNYYSISTSASVTNSNSGTQTSEILYCLAAPTITVTLTSTSLTSTAVSTNPSGITLTYTYTLYSGVPGSGSVVGSSNTTGSFTISGTSYYIVVYSSYSSTRLSTISATTQTIQPLFGTISFTASTSLSVAGSCIGATTLTFTLFSSSSEAGTFTQVGTAYVFTGTSTTRVFASLIAGTVYNVRLSATNGTSTTSILSSNYWCIAAPTSFSVTSMSLTTVNFSWTQPSGANSYTLTYGSSTQTLTGSSGSLTISSLTNNTNYLCSLKATNTLYYSSGINSSASGTLYFAFIVVSGTTVSYNWVAPATLTYTIRIAGAAGQNAPNGNAGGRGGILTVSKSITTSTSVPVTIGTGGGGTINQSGNSNPNADGWGGVPGGGTGYGRSSGGGGGYTKFDVCIGGGGGGGGGCAYSGDGSTGGAGGGTTGATGGVGSLPSPNSRTIGGGAGGSQSAGGAGGTVTNPLSGFDGNQAANGANGSSLLGGNGGNSNGGDGNGGAGGGGYYGGGGGSGFQIPYSSAHTGGGGGGGSSYYPNTYTLISNGQGTGPSAASGNMGIGGNGYVLINS